MRAQTSCIEYIQGTNKADIRIGPGGVEIGDRDRDRERRHDRDRERVGDGRGHDRHRKTVTVEEDGRTRQTRHCEISDAH
jgi:hypothetical protein